MKIFVIKSDYSDVPLAEIRTDGRVLDFVVDNTNGKLPDLFQNSYQRMIQVVQKSSHLTIEQPKKATVNLLRYVMDNGDVVEITSDGHTCMLNGDLIDQETKDALFAAIKRGDIKVARKTDIQEALPIVSTPPLAEQAPAKPVNVSLSSGVLDMINKQQAERERNQKLASKKYDQDIENARLHQAEDKEWTRKMMYWLKYGDE
jgi:hypothetical protein